MDWLQDDCNAFDRNQLVHKSSVNLALKRQGSCLQSKSSKVIDNFSDQLAFIPRKFSNKTISADDDKDAEEVGFLNDNDEARSEERLRNVVTSPELKLLFWPPR